MFRESDEKKVNLHPSYTNKPVPQLQIQSQIGRFDDSAKSARLDNNLKVNVSAVPTTWDTYYDPSHHDADWSGLVSLKNNQKKHSNDHRSQQLGIVREEFGIVSKEEKKEWPHRRPADESIVHTNKSSFVIGGLNEESERWKTSYKRFEAQEPTSKEQLIYIKRVGTKKVIPDPAQMKSMKSRNNNENYFDNQNNQSSSVYMPEQSTMFNQSNSLNEEKSLVGYRAPELKKKSLISNIGLSIVDSITDEMPKLNSANNIDRRNLITENYKPLPGYTGRRIY